MELPTNSYQSSYKLSFKRLMKTFLRDKQNIHFTHGLCSINSTNDAFYAYITLK